MGAKTGAQLPKSGGAAEIGREGPEQESRFAEGVGTSPGWVGNRLEEQRLLWPLEETHNPPLNAHT